jgi:hypothetical protein
LEFLARHQFQRYAPGNIKLIKAQKEEDGIPFVTKDIQKANAQGKSLHAWLEELEKNKLNRLSKVIDQRKPLAR